jgi:putative ABC transport system permease protein
MLFKLALNNMRRSLRDFTVYFLTLTLGVAIFYVFNSIASQQAVMNLTSGQATALETLSQLMNNFSLLMAVVLAGLIIYANRFLIKRRQPEFGLYLTLGMERQKISLILIIETILVGPFALVVGLIVGCLVSQVMAMLTTNLMGVNVTSFQFIFSLEAAISAVIFFGLTFLIVLVFNVVMIRRQRLIDLIYGHRRNQTLRSLRLGLSVGLFLLSVGLLALAYILITSDGWMAKGQFWLSIISGLIGTFLFFFSLSGFFLTIMKRLKSIYFKGLAMFSLRQINSQIHTTYISMTIVCLILFVAIATLSSGIGLAQAVTDDIASQAPFDATLSLTAADANDHQSGRYPANGVDIVANLRQHGVDLSKLARNYLALRFYEGETPLFNLQTSGGKLLEAPLSYVKLSTFNQARLLKGETPISLASHQFAVDSPTGYGQFIELTRPSLIRQNIHQNGVHLTTDPSLVFSDAITVTSHKSLSLIVVVADELLNDAPASSDELAVQYLSPNSQSTVVRQLSNFRINGLDSQLETKVQIIEKSRSNTTTLAYLAVYLGVTFLIAAATVLAISQLSEASDNRRRYQLLSQLGTDQTMIDQAILWQIALYFGLPLILATVHALVAIQVAAGLFKSFRQTDILTTSLITLAVIVLIYGGYFLVTYLGSKNLINRELQRT